MTNKNKINESNLGVSDNKTTVNIKKTDLTNSSVTNNIKNLGADVNVNVVGEDKLPTKTLTSSQVHKLAQQAGNFGVDVKEELINLLMLGDVIPVSMVKKILNNHDLTFKDLKGQDSTFKPSNEFAHLFNSSLNEELDVIEPTDRATMKYLSNVKDPKTNEIVQPFSVGDKKYQMVRARTPDKKIVLGVYSFDDINDSGDNTIYDIEEFENKVAKPMLEMEKLTVEGETKTTEPETLGLGEFKHFIVSEKTGKFKKFKTIPELAATTMGDDERYMGLQEFKKFFETRVFGATKKKELSEVGMTGNESDEEMTVKAQKLMSLIQKKIPSNTIESIKTNKIAQKEVIAAFAEMIGVPRNGLSSLVQGIRDLANGQQQQQQQQVSENRVIKTIKKKDIK